MHRTHTPAAVLLALLLAACGGRGEGGAAPPESGVMDTTNQQAIDGLSRRQIERQAQPMTPEQAEALGLVDTTIHIESERADSGFAPDPTDGLPPGRPAAPAAPPDTAP